MTWSMYEWSGYRQRWPDTSSPWPPLTDHSWRYSSRWSVLKEHCFRDVILFVCPSQVNTLNDHFWLLQLTSAAYSMMCETLPLICICLSYAMYDCCLNWRRAGWHSTRSFQTLWNLRPTCKIFAVLPWAPEVAVPSALWNGGHLCPFCPYFHKADPCILSGWPFRVEWTSVGTAIAPQGSFCSSLKTVLFSRAGIWNLSE